MQLVRWHALPFIDHWYGSFLFLVFLGGFFGLEDQDQQDLE